MKKYRVRFYKVELQRQGTSSEVPLGFLDLLHDPKSKMTLLCRAFRLATPYQSQANGVEITEL